MSIKTWEDAVQWLRQQPDQQNLVSDCYFDDPLLDACERYANSGEWIATSRYLPLTSGSVLDIGAGRGISSYALAKEGWNVTALEPDTSAIVGSQSIEQIVRETGLPIKIVVDWGESLPFSSAQFDVVLARQVLHHARDLGQLCQQISRVLKPGGVLIATREHVISQHKDLPKFLSSHPLHHLYQGEHAYLLDEYVGAISRAGLTLEHTLSPWESEINYFPMSREEWYQTVIRPLKRRFGSSIAEFLANQNTIWGKLILRKLIERKTLNDHSAGRLYSFVARK